jgi:Ca2+-binding RTX toxin-like protein
MGHDSVDGGPGSDTVDYSTEPAGVVVDLAKDESLESAGKDSLSSIENATGSRYADKLIGDAGNNVLIGGPGQDQLIGGGGHDTLKQ